MTQLDEQVKEILEKFGWSTCPEIAKILAKEDKRTSYYTTRQKVFRTLATLEKYKIVERKRVQNMVFWRLSQ